MADLEDPVCEELVNDLLGRIAVQESTEFFRDGIQFFLTLLRQVVLLAAERSGSAAGRVADRPLQPVVMPRLT
jgi:hypothetical protein